MLCPASINTRASRQASLLRVERRTVDSLALPHTRRTVNQPFLAAAFTDLCLALLNANEFVYVD